MSILKENRNNKLKVKFIKTAASLFMITSLIVSGGDLSHADGFRTEKINGTNRFDTAINISRYAYPSGSKNVIIVNYEKVADALSVSPLSAAIEAPVLLTKPSSLNMDTENEIKRLGARHITVIGGESSVSETVINKLRDSGYEVERISGRSRMDTSAEIADKLKNVLDIETFESCYIVDGNKGLADAAGAGAAAAKTKSPLIFVSGNMEKSKRLLDKLDYKKAYIIGGAASMYKSELENSVSIYGAGRRETNIKIAEKFFGENSQNAFVVKSGKNNESQLIDAVAVGGVAGKYNSPVIFIDKNVHTSKELKNFVRNNGIEVFTQVGGGIDEALENFWKEPEIMPEYRVLGVKHLNQYDAGAPMGCEAASLLQALHYKGYAMNKNLYTFIREMPLASDNNPNHGFAGTPFKVTGGIYQSIFPEPLAKWGQKYGSVYNISGSSPDDIRKEIAKGNPVVFFGTYKFESPVYYNYFWGKNAIINAHVMVVDGYSRDKMHIVDPAVENSGYWVSRTVFDRIYNLKRYAVVVR